MPITLAAIDRRLDQIAANAALKAELSAVEWARAGRMHLAVGYSDEFIEIYFARGLQAGTAQLDEGEFVEVITATVEEFLEACRTGVVTDAKTLSTAVWVQNALRGPWKLDWQP